MHIPSSVKIHWCLLKLSSRNEKRTDDRQTDRHTHVQRETIIPRHYCVVGYKKPLAMIRPRTIKLIGRIHLKSRWPLSQRSRSPWLLVSKKLVFLQCLWLGPSNLAEMLVLTSRMILRAKVKVTMTISILEDKTLKIRKEVGPHQ